MNLHRTTKGKAMYFNGLYHFIFGSLALFHLLSVLQASAWGRRGLRLPFLSFYAAKIRIFRETAKGLGGKIAPTERNSEAIATVLQFFSYFF
jgi:hypothetical protein